MRFIFKSGISINYIYIFILDILISIISTYSAFSLRLEDYHLLQSLNEINSVYAYMLCMTVFIPLFIYFDIYKNIIRFTSIHSVINIILACFFYSILLLVLFNLFELGIPRSLAIIQPIIFCLLACIIRIVIFFQISSVNRETIHNLLVYGAGKAGSQLNNSITMSGNYKVKGFIDDDPRKQGRKIAGINIFSLNKIEKIIKEKNIKTIVIAIPSLSILERKKIVKRLSKYDVAVKIIPDILDLMDSNISISDFKSLNIDDYLDREIKIINEKLNILENKNIIITGAGGSIGNELSKQIIAQNPKKIILIDNSEYNLYKVSEDLEKIISHSEIKTELIFTLVSVNNLDRLENIFNLHRPQIVFHAAAYKHVNLVEKNIIESVENNYIGTKNLVEISEKYLIENFILISSDKAVRPTSIMGSTKRLSELLVQAHADKKSYKSDVIYSIVRFGNVLGSSGSVINKFDQQIKNREPITVTDKEVTRYFMTIYEAVNLILQTLAMSKGGEVFLLDMGKPIKIFDLAKKMVKYSGLTVKDKNNPNGEIEIKIIGLRPGEKLYEELLIDKKSYPTSNPNIYYANEKYFDKVIIDKLSNQLNEKIKENSPDEIIQIIKQYV